MQSARYILLVTRINGSAVTGDAEAYVRISLGGIASIILLSKIIDLLAKLNCFMQKQSADFSRLSLILDCIEKVLKENGSDWCLEVTSTVSLSLLPSGEERFS